MPAQLIVEGRSHEVLDAGEVGELAESAANKRWLILGIGFDAGSIETYEDGRGKGRKVRRVRAPASLERIQSPVNVQPVVAGTTVKPVIDTGGAGRRLVEVGFDEVLDTGEVDDLTENSTSERRLILRIGLNAGSIETYNSCGKR